MAGEKTRGEIIDWLASYYSAYYDVHRQEEEMHPLVLRCDLHVNNQKYFLFRKNVLWEANCHEYVYVFSGPRLTEEVYRRCEEFTREEGCKLIDPKPGHLYPYLTCLLIADETEPQAVKMRKKSRIQQSFRFSLRGWMELHTAALDCSKEKIFTNFSGRANAKLFNHII